MEKMWQKLMFQCDGGKLNWLFERFRETFREIDVCNDSKYQISFNNYILSLP